MTAHTSLPARASITDRVRDALRAALRATEPAEPCGCLLGTVDGAELEVLRAVVARNAHPAPEGAWALDPEEQLLIARAARVEGLRVVGYWHGHLVGPAVPGAADHAGRSPLGPDLHLIAGRAPRGRIEVRAWRAGTSGFEEIPISESASPPRPPP